MLSAKVRVHVKGGPFLVHGSNYGQMPFLTLPIFRWLPVGLEP